MQSKVVLKISIFVIFIFCGLCPHPSQLATINATCVYTLDSRNVYTCAITNAVVINPTDELQITGQHLEGYTNSHVETVNHVNSNIRYFNGEVFRIFQNLKKLHIVEQGLMEINANAFDVCPNLEELITGFDRTLTSLPAAMLKNCQNLKTFVAINHNLTALPADLFGSNSKLEMFIVTGNKLTSVPGNLLQNMANLTSFDVSSNLLTELSPNLLKNAQNLERVNLGNNQFVDQETVQNALNGLTNLRNLYLHDNNFENFNFELFSQFQKLLELYIGSTEGPLLTSISWQSLPSSLINLIVDGIGEDLPGTSFNNLVNLRSLSLSGFGIVNLHKDTFKPIADLLELYIESTNIKSLHAELFTNQINLSSIGLNNNKIEELPAGIFAPLVNLGIRSSLKGIRMNYNNIQRLNANSFGQHPYMQSISFVGNKINEIERGLFSHFHPNMTTANFWSNVCIDRSFSFSANLDQNDDLLWCFNNWAGITTTTTSTSTSTQPPTTTTPGAAGSNFREFEVFVIVTVGFMGFLINFIK